MDVELGWNRGKWVVGEWLMNLNIQMYVENIAEN